MASVWIETRKKLSGDKYRIVWREVLFKDGEPYNGPRKPGRFVSDPRVADSLLRAKREELELVEGGLPPKRTNKTLRECADLYLDHSQKHKAFRTYHNFDRPAILDFVSFLGNHKKIASISTDDIQGFENGMSKYRTTSVSIRLRVVRTFLTYCLKSGWIDSVPHFHIPEGDTVGRVIEPKEIAALLDRAQEQLRKGLIILLHTGMRTGELFSLRGENIKKGLDGWEATIRTLKRRRGEGGRHRVILLHPEALKVIGDIKPGSVMQKTRGRFENAFKWHVKALKLPRTRLHDFRHTWATKFMEETGDLYGLMRLGGWKDLKSVERYQHLTRGRSKAILGLDFGISDTHQPPKKTVSV